MATANPKSAPSPRVRYAADNIGELAIRDLSEGLKRHELWWTLAVVDIKQRFQRSVLGPLWLTLSMGILVGALGFVMSNLFKQDISQFLPYLAVGIIFWNLLTTIIGEGCWAFIGAEGYIKNVPMPLSVHLYRMLARNVLIWLHNMVIYVGVFLYFGHGLSWQYLAFIPGLIIFMIVASQLAVIAAILCTRFRDIPPIITNVLQIGFIITPVFWTVASFPTRPAFIHWNPLYHLIEIVRAPLLGTTASTESWMVCTLLAIALIPVTLYLYRRVYARIPYWV